MTLRRALALGINALLTQQNVGVDKFCEQAGIDKRLMYRAKKGVTIPRAEHLEKMAEAFGVEESDIILVGLKLCKETKGIIDEL